MFKVGDKVETVDAHPMTGVITGISQVGCLTQVSVDTTHGPWLFKDSELRKKGPKFEERQEFRTVVLSDKDSRTVSEVDLLLGSVDVIMWASKLNLGDINTDAQFSHYNAGQKIMHARRKIRQLFQTNPEICKHEHSAVLNGSKASKVSK